VPLPCQGVTAAVAALLQLFCVTTSRSKPNKFLVNFSPACRLPNDVSGWWEIFAQVLAVVVLLALAAVTGHTARALSAKIDRNAMADVARSNPLEVCITGAESLSGWAQSQGPLLLVPDFRWPNGSSVSLVHTLPPADARNEITLFGGHRNNILLDDITLSAMYRCGLVAGHASQAEFVAAIRTRKNAPDGWPNVLPLPHHELNVSVGLDGCTHKVGLLTYGGTLMGLASGPTDEDKRKSNKTDLYIRKKLGPLQSSATYDLSETPTRPFNATEFQVNSFMRSWQRWPNGSDDVVQQLFVRFARNWRANHDLIDVNFLHIAPQDASASECMAHHSKVDADMLLRSHSVGKDAEGRLLYFLGRKCYT
jgi:hypothetical protein